MPSSDTKLPEQQSSKTYHNKNNQADTPPQIPSIKISEQSQITEKDPNNACSWENLPYPRSLSHHQMIQVQHKKEIIVKVMKKMRYGWNWRICLLIKRNLLSNTENQNNHSNKEVKEWKCRSHNSNVQ